MIPTLEACTGTATTGIPCGWKLMLRGSHGDGNKCGGAHTGLKNNLAGPKGM